MTTSIITRGSGVSVAGRRSRGLSPAFSRASAAYQSDGRLVGVGVPRFETVDGRRGVLVEEGTTNILNYEASFNRWSSGSSNMANLTTRTGKHSFTVKGTSTVPGAYSYVYPYFATSNTQHSLSCQVRNNNNKTLIARAIIRDGSNGITLSDNVKVQIPAGQTRKLTVSTSTAVSSSQVTPAVSIFSDAGDGSVDAEVFMAQCEAKPYATSFVDGTRAREALQIPADMLNPQEGTVEFWAWLPDGSRSYLFSVAGSPDNRNRMFVYGTSTGESAQLVKVLMGDGVTAAITPEVSVARREWHYCAVRWTPTRVQLTVDSTTVQAVRSGGAPTFGSTAYIGSSLGGTEANAHISCLRLHRRALSDEEIAAHAAGGIGSLGDCYHYPFDGDLWPASGSLGAVVAPSIITRPGKLEVIGR